MDFLEGIRLEVGIVLAVVAIVVVGKMLTGNGTQKRNRGSTSEDERSEKRQRDESTNSAPQDEVEAVVAKVADLKDGELKEFPLGEEGKVLVVKDKDQIFATATKCSHAGAPLKNGVYCEGRIRCPWHGACFSAKTGDIEDYPCVDAIQSFKTQVKNGEVIVRAPKSSLKTHKRVPKMVKKNDLDKRVVIIVGGGPAGLTCAETLRQEGYGGRIVMISKENILPYDRTKLSKNLNSKPREILLRSPEFFEEHSIETILGVEVTEIDAPSKSVTLSDGRTMSYDFSLIATGGDPRSLPVPGMDLLNIFQLRVPEESQGITNLVDGKKVVIVGTSFIGMEAAACIAKRASSVIAIGMENVPFERVLGPQIGASLQKLHERNGIAFRLKRVVKEFRGNEGKVSAVVLDDGEVLEAELVIIGAGIIPSTKCVKKDTLELGRDGSIIVNEFMETKVQGTYAAGDIARFPYHLTGEIVRVEHYGMSQFQGRIAALNILGKKTPCRSVPFFWTTQYGKSVRYSGHALSWDDLLVDGNIEELSFVAFYARKGQIVAVVAVGRDPIVSLAAELFQAGRMPSVDQLKANQLQLQ